MVPTLETERLTLRAWRQADLEPFRADDGRRYLILQIEDVVERAVEMVRPKMRASGSIDELSRDTNSVYCFANTPFQHSN